MASPKKSTRSKGKREELAAQADPRAALDSAALLAAAKPVLRRLEEDLQARATASSAVAVALTARYEAEKKAQRTADSFPGWTAALSTQVAAAWFLSCVFVRTLEDRGLLKQARLAGPGAEDSQKQFFQLTPSLTERDYLLTVFRELARHPAAASLFDVEHSLVWKLSPSAEVSKELLELFRSPSASEPAFRFGQSSTRFLGDLYQDLSEDVRKRYALLQTPDFVEAYILDRTLEPAIARFGIDDTTLIDPTCGSGHFLLGAFDRLFEHRLRAEPGLDARIAATKALDSVYGADINPYAVAIARFRLTLSFLDKAGYAKLSDAPTLPLHLVCADSLRINPQHPQQELWQHAGASSSAWLGDVFAFDEERAAKDVLGRQYAAVVGNPPYITVKDAAIREVYRNMYASCHRSYSLSVPFCERFFQLARPRGYTGQITANSFMKREFGKPLIEEYLPTVNLNGIVNTSGAYIPGHGTPTVLLFGTHEPPQGTDVLAVLAKRGEPSTPDEPSRGLVWRSVVEHGDQSGFENEYLSVAHVGRESLKKHPWSLGGGGASELKELLEERAASRLSEHVDEIGRSTHTGEDGIFFIDAATARRLGFGERSVVPLVKGEQVRDWSLAKDEVSLFPYDLTTAEAVEPPAGPEAQYYWRYRTVLRDRQDFGEKIEARGLRWFEHSMFFPRRFIRPLGISFAFVATHNHFVLDRGGKVFNRSAPIIKLPEGATEEDHLALLAYLNSSTACFWMKQVFHKKSSASQKHHTDPARAAYEFAATALLELPVPDLRDPVLVKLARRLSELAGERAAWLSGERIGTLLAQADKGHLAAGIDGAWSEYDRTTQQAAYLQEELDWHVYELFQFAKTNVEFEIGDAEALGARPFEVAEGYNAGLSDRVRGDETPRRAVKAPGHWATRKLDDVAALIEGREFKRMWRDTEMNVDQAEFRVGLTRNWLESSISDALERTVRDVRETISLRSMIATVELDLRPVLAVLNEEQATATSRRLAESDAVPYLAALRHTEEGLANYAEWLATWEAQRAEDGGAAVNPKPAPKYEQGHYLSPDYWRLRGKLDVPKERFISYPHCESDQDGEPVYGWAGWDHLQRAQALAALYLKRKHEGWTAARLTPMLAGLLELIPWVRQWHNEPSAEFNGLRMGEYFEQFLDGECRTHGLTRDDLRAWRPEKKTRAKTKPRSPANAEVAADEGEAEAPAKPKKTRAKKKETATDADPTVATEGE